MTGHKGKPLGGSRGSGRREELCRTVFIVVVGEKEARQNTQI